MTDTIQDKYGYEAAERAAIYEYDGGMTRQMAESKVIHEQSIKKKLVVDIDMKRKQR